MEISHKICEIKVLNMFWDMVSDKIIALTSKNMFIHEDASCETDFLHQVCVSVSLTMSMQCIHSFVDVDYRFLIKNYFQNSFTVLHVCFFVDAFFQLMQSLCTNLVYRVLFYLEAVSHSIAQT